MLTELRRERIALLITAALGVALCFVPMASVLGPESALGLGVLMPPLCVVVGARVAHRNRVGLDSAGEVLATSLGVAWTLLALPVGLLALNALRVKTCAPWSGLAFIALGPWSGGTFAAVIGATLGLLLPSRRFATSLGAAVVLLALAVDLYDLWATPAVFAYGHFFGYFPGTFYDRNVQLPEALWHLRGTTLLMAVGIAYLADALWRRGRGLQPWGLRKRPGHAVMVTLCAALSAWAASQAEAWGTRTSSAWIASQLGRQLRSERCVLVVPRELPMDDALLLAEECDFQLTRLESGLGVHVPGPVVAYFFRDAQEKRRLMGAERVYVAKPWRDEVYLQLGGWPHPVLSHELAHIVAGRAGAGPFRIAGVWGGFKPEPTLIEGMAVAMAWRPRDGLTPDQWARAAREAGLAPELRNLVGTGFFSHNQHLAYTLAGSFLHFVGEQYGAKALRATYQLGDVERATGQPVEDLQRAWLAHLDTVSLPDSARALAQLRFERPGVFGEVCPHEVERLRLELHGALHAGDHGTAVQRCQEILRIDPTHAESRALLVGALARAGELPQAEEQLRSLEEAADTPPATLALARTALADAAWRAGDLTRAQTMLENLLDAPHEESALRGLEVKTLGLQAPAPQRRWIRELLVGDGGIATDPRVVMHAIDQLEELRDDGLGAYLRGRQLHHVGRYDLAHAAFREALARGLPLSRLTREAWRLRGHSAFALADFDDARQSFSALASHNDASPIERLEAQRWQSRLDYVKSKQPRARLPVSAAADQPLPPR